MLCIEAVKQMSENLHCILHVAEAAVLVVAVVDARMAVTTYLDVEAILLEVSNEGKATCDAV